jgi:crotonobetainyl-CoA:carnitine CoA-transferase CaiB-like acyl-CoA transferase
VPLRGIKVADLSRYLPGPYCTMMLADYGAEVIKVEQPHEVRKKRKTFQQDKLSLAELRRAKAFEIFNRNKQAILVNFRNPEGREVVERLVRQSDVLIHDYRPGVMEAAGLGYDQLKAINPRLVYCAVTLCGQTGPYRDLPGHDPVSLSLTGVLTRFGDGPEAPRQVGAPVADIVTALHAVNGVLLALRARERTGEGQLVDIAMSDATFSIVTSSIQRLLANGVEPPRNLVMANNGVWRTKDGKFICTTDMEPAYWDRFCDMVERPDLKSRLHDRPRTDNDLEAIFLRHTRDEWFDLIRRHNTQGAPVLSLAEALQDPHARARGNVVETVTPDGETILHIGPLIKLAQTPGTIRHTAHMPGEDTRSVLEGLGYSSDQIERLTDEA